MRRVAAVVLAGLCLSSVSATSAATDTTASVLTRPLPAWRQGFPFEWKRGEELEHFLRYLRRRSGVPLVWESTTTPGRTPAQTIDLSDKDLRAALNTIVAVDPRYTWREFDGVIVVRPAAAWSSPSNPINQRIGAITWPDVGPDEIAWRIHSLILDTPITEAWPAKALLPRLSISVASGSSVLDLLIAIARPYPQIAWSAKYWDTAQKKRALMTVQYFDSSTHEIGATAGVGRHIMLPPSLAGS